MTELKILKIEYPNWIYLEGKASKAFDIIWKENGRVPESDYSRIFEKYVDKHFITWDNLSCCMNGDRQYAPVVICYYAEKNGIKPSYPINVIRLIVDKLKDQIE